MKVTVCIGSSCHVRGSRQVVEQLQQTLASLPAPETEGP